MLYYLYDHYQTSEREKQIIVGVHLFLEPLNFVFIQLLDLASASYISTGILKAVCLSEKSKIVT